jgi:hypothetical protein
MSDILKGLQDRNGREGEQPGEEGVPAVLRHQFQMVQAERERRRKWRSFCDPGHFDLQSVDARNTGHEV